MRASVLGRGPIGLVRQFLYGLDATSLVSSSGSSASSKIGPIKATRLMSSMIDLPLLGFSPPHGLTPANGQSSRSLLCSRRASESSRLSPDPNHPALHGLSIHESGPSLTREAIHPKVPRLRPPPSSRRLHDAGFFGLRRSPRRPCSLRNRAHLFAPSSLRLRQIGRAHV